MVQQSSLATIQKSSARLCRHVTILFASLSVLLVLERFSAVVMKLFAEGIRLAPLRRLAFQCVAACPEVFYLLALWGIRQSLAALAEGKLYTFTVTRMLHRVGIMLATGAFISVFLVPSVAWALGFGPGYLIAFDVSGLVLGAIGLSLGVIAHVLHRAGELQTELEEMF